MIDDEQQHWLDPRLAIIVPSTADAFTTFWICNYIYKDDPRLGLRPFLVRLRMFWSFTQECCWWWRISNGKEEYYQCLRTSILSVLFTCLSFLPALWSWFYKGWDDRLWLWWWIWAFCISISMVEGVSSAFRCWIYSDHCLWS